MPVYEYECKKCSKLHEQWSSISESKELSVCPSCGGEDLDWNITPYYTPAGKYKAFRCECGAIGRSRFSDLSPEERKNITLSVAR